MSLKPFALIAPDACVVTCGYRLHSEIISRSLLLIRHHHGEMPIVRLSTSNVFTMFLMISGLHFHLCITSNWLTWVNVNLWMSLISHLKPVWNGSTAVVSPVSFLFFRACHAILAESNALDSLFLEEAHDLWCLAKAKSTGNNLPQEQIKADGSIVKARTSRLE